MSKILDELRDEIELEGFEPGTEAFERVFLARRVRRCQEMQGVSECQNCKAFDYCNLAKDHLISLKYGGK